MAHPYPLQSGDRAPNFSGSDSSKAADRRMDDDNPSTENQPGANAAPSYGAPEALEWRAGQPPPVAWQRAPFAVTSSNDAPVDTIEIDCSIYGDAYDPNAPLRVRQDNEWNFDPDHDGKV